jgi:hypothetical protein
MKNDTPKSSLWDDLEPKEKDVSTHTHKHTPKLRERKTARIQILTYPSIVEKLDHYARMNGLSRAEAFERAVLDFLESNT